MQIQRAARNSMQSSSWPLSVSAYELFAKFRCKLLEDMQVMVDIGLRMLN